MSRSIDEEEQRVAVQLLHVGPRDEALQPEHRGFRLSLLRVRSRIEIRRNVRRRKMQFGGSKPDIEEIVDNRPTKDLKSAVA